MILSPSSTKSFLSLRKTSKSLVLSAIVYGGTMGSAQSWLSDLPKEQLDQLRFPFSSPASVASPAPVALAPSPPQNGTQPNGMQPSAVLPVSVQPLQANLQASSLSFGPQGGEGHSRDHAQGHTQEILAHMSLLGAGLQEQFRQAQEETARQIAKITAAEARTQAQNEGLQRGIWELTQRYREGEHHRGLLLGTVEKQLQEAKEAETRSQETIADLKNRLHGSEIRSRRIEEARDRVAAEAVELKQQLQAAQDAQARGVVKEAEVKKQFQETIADLENRLHGSEIRSRRIEEARDRVAAEAVELKQQLQAAQDASRNAHDLLFHVKIQAEKTEKAAQQKFLVLEGQVSRAEQALQAAGADNQKVKEALQEAERNNQQTLRVAQEKEDRLRQQAAEAACMGQQTIQALQEALLTARQEVQNAQNNFQSTLSLLRAEAARDAQLRKQEAEAYRQLLEQAQQETQGLNQQAFLAEEQRDAANDLVAKLENQLKETKRGKQDAENRAGRLVEQAVKANTLAERVQGSWEETKRELRQRGVELENARRNAVAQVAEISGLQNEVRGYQRAVEAERNNRERRVKELLDQQAQDDENRRRVEEENQALRDRVASLEKEKNDWRQAEKKARKDLEAPLAEAEERVKKDFQAEKDQRKKLEEQNRRLKKELSQAQKLARLSAALEGGDADAIARAVEDLSPESRAALYRIVAPENALDEWSSSDSDEGSQSDNEDPEVAKQRVKEARNNANANIFGVSAA